MKTSRNLFETFQEPQKSSNNIRIAFDHSLEKQFDYIVPDNLWPIVPGQRVEAPFGRGNNLTSGFCVDINQCQDTSKLKAITAVIDDKPLISKKMLELAKWICDYYVCPLGQVLSAMVPSGVKKGLGFVKKRFIRLAIEGQELENAINAFRSNSKQKLLLEILLNRNMVEQSTGMQSDELLGLAETGSQTLRKLIDSKLVISETKSLLKEFTHQGNAEPAKKIQLNDAQEKCLAHIFSEIDAARFGVSVIHGVTGSGKTEVYIRALEKVVAKGLGGIILLPEIALTAQTINRFKNRFENLAVLHSRLTNAERSSEWHRINAGQVDVVVGARSAVFAPLANLGMIVVDEEHEPTYKQDTAPRYNARDVAVKRCHSEKAHCLLGSATPSFESYYNALNRPHYKLLELPERVAQLPMPAMQVVDMSGRCDFMSGFMIGDILREDLYNAIKNGEQAILLLNRRGYSNYVYCPSCHYTLHCRNCDACLNFHLNENPTDIEENTLYMAKGFATCHHCGSKMLVPKKCPACHNNLTMRGAGSQKLAEELQEKLPKARIARIDTDSMKDKDYFELIEKFANHEIDILAGTQMLAKGLHFPNVTLVGVINADASLSIVDFRAAERTFQLISQVAGRTGRGDKNGKVIVQTGKQDHPAIKFALQHDFRGFYENQIGMRQILKLPPVSRAATVQIRHEKHNIAESSSQKYLELINLIIDKCKFEIVAKGPYEPSIGRVGREFRFNISLGIKDSMTMMRFFNILRDQPNPAGNAKVVYDIDPMF